MSLTVLDEAGWWRAISLRGRVASLEDDPELVDIDRISQHYEGAPYPNRARPRVSAWVEVASWHAWGL